MANLTDPATLYDPIEGEHPTVEEDPNWQNRGSQSELTSKLWHGPDGDFGALTRFGMGWGPVEVRRTARAIDEDHRVTRVLTVVLDGKPAVRVQATGLHLDEVLVLDDGVRELEVPPTRLDHVECEDEDPPDAVYVGVGTADETTVLVARLQAEVEKIQEVLTEDRRAKRYVPRAAMDAIDEITRLVGATVNDA